MNINLRLKSIINEIEGTSLADIGCDHGIVSVNALIENKVKRVIACDISDKSLDKARNLARQNNIKNIEFRCGDGLSVINDGEIDCVVIAGMGGCEIINILSKKLDSIERYVLLAHTHVKDLREFLVANSLKIIKDEVLYSDKHYYTIIVAEKGKDKLTKKEILLGRDSLKNEFYKNYLLYLKDKNNFILKNCTDSNKKEEIKEVLDLIEGELNEG